MLNQWYPYHIWSTAPQFNEYHKDTEKIAAVFSNPALLKIFSIQCDLFSLARPYVYKKNGTTAADDPALDRLAQPNPMQSTADWLWCFMFYKMLGNAYLYMESDVVDRTNAPMYWLENHKIEWPLDLEKQKDKLFLSEAKLNKVRDTPLIYRYEDGSKMEFPLKQLVLITDLTNGTGNWFKGFSKIDSLYKVISNSEIALDSKNINVRYAGKFLVAGTTDPADVTRKIMGEDEKRDIEEKTNNNKPVHAVKSMIDIKRFVDDLKVLELDKAYLADYFLIGNMYGIPRDILEAYQSSTYENQEKAQARHVAYTMEPAGEMLGAALAKRWGYAEKGKRIAFGWDHLSFSQIFEGEKARIQQTKIQTFSTMLNLGIPIDQINSFLDTNFTIDEKEPINEGNKSNISNARS